MVRTVVFKARIECIECGGVVFLDGPVRTAKCEACKSVITVPDDWWEIIREADEGYEDTLPPTGLRNGSVKKGVTMVYSRGRAQAVLCLGCDAPLELEAFRWGVDPAVTCGQCGAATHAFPVPKWLVPFAGRAKYLFGALAEGQDLESDSLPDTEGNPTLDPMIAQPGKGRGCPGVETLVPSQR